MSGGKNSSRSAVDGVVEVCRRSRRRGWVDLGLRDGVVARVGPGLGGAGSLLFVVGITALADRGGGAVGVGHRDLGEGHVAGVGDDEGVGHDLTGPR